MDCRAQAGEQQLVPIERIKQLDILHDTVGWGVFSSGIGTAFDKSGRRIIPAAWGVNRQMDLAAATLDFGSFHAVGMVGRVNDTFLADRLVKTGPAATTFKHGIALK